MATSDDLPSKMMARQEFVFWAHVSSPVSVIRKKAETWLLPRGYKSDGYGVFTNPAAAYYEYDVVRNGTGTDIEIFHRLPQKRSVMEQTERRELSPFQVIIGR